MLPTCAARARVALDLVAPVVAGALWNVADEALRALAAEVLARHPEVDRAWLSARRTEILESLDRELQ